MSKRIRQIIKKRYKVGDVYIPAQSEHEALTVKAVYEISGIQCPTRASYDNGELIDNRDLVQRIVLSDGEIRYVKL